MLSCFFRVFISLKVGRNIVSKGCESMRARFSRFVARLFFRYLVLRWFLVFWNYLFFFLLDSFRSYKGII